MVIKLKLILQNPRLLLIFKTIIFASSLLLVKIGSFGITPILFFIIAVSLLFFWPIFRVFKYITLYILFLILGLLFIKYLTGYYFLVGVIFLSFLFYWLLAMKNLVLVDRFRTRLIFNLALFYLTFFLFFISRRESFFTLKLLGIFLVALLLLKGLKHWPLVVSWILAFLIIQIIWAISLLPIGLFQSANLALLIVFILQDLSVKYFAGLLTRRTILIDITIFVLLMLLIFITSSWSI